MKNLTKILLILIWVNQLFGLFGILYIDFDLFLSLSPISLVTTFLVVMYSNIEFTYKSYGLVFIIIIVSMVSEIIGVNSGLLFGSYYYGENLGISVFGVPLVIGLNWVVLTISCGNVSYYIFSKNKILSILLGSFLMLFLDVIMEQVSGDIDFWYFNDDNLIYNYVCWFLLGLLNQYIYQNFLNKKCIILSINIYISFIIFFLVLNFNEYV